MKILLTNDDGFDAEGLQIVKEKLAKYGDVTVVAPFEAMSAKSASITLCKWMKVDRIDDSTYAVHGTPTDCSMFALGELGEDFDLVVSGCNNGPNLSYDNLLSGTIGACIGAMIHHKKSIAISAPFDDFSCLKEHFDEIFEFVLKHNLLSDQYCVNINLPKGDIYKGIKIGKIYYRTDHYYYDINEDGDYYALRDLEDFDNMPDYADCKQVHQGYASITPLSRLPFNEEFYQNFLEKTKK